MQNLPRNKLIFLVIGTVLVTVVGLVGLYFLTDIFSGIGVNTGKSPGISIQGQKASAVVGVEVYDLSMYDDSYQQYLEAEALNQMEEDWFPRQAIVQPKGPEGGEFPNAPLPIYDAYPEQDGFTEDGESYTITRTWIGDIAVGTEVALEGVVGQGDWCFVTSETIGGWKSSGWVWCYRLFIPARSN